MLPKLKLLGLALVAVLALSAITASTASAQFESEASETRLTVSSNEPQVFHFEEGGVQVTCNTITTSSIVTGKENTVISVEPEYLNCSKFLGLFGVTIHHNSCYYTFTLARTATTGSAHIECKKAGDSMTITVGSGGTLCTTHIFPQTAVGGVIHFSNTGRGPHGKLRRRIQLTRWSRLSQARVRVVNLQNPKRGR
jgi:hypothetical protein